MVKLSIEARFGAFVVRTADSTGQRGFGSLWSMPRTVVCFGWAQRRGVRQTAGATRHAALPVRKVNKHSSVLLDARYRSCVAAVMSPAPHRR